MELKGYSCGFCPLDKYLYSCLHYTAKVFRAAFSFAMIFCFFWDATLSLSVPVVPILGMKKPGNALKSAYDS